MILRILLRYLRQFWSFLGHFRVDKVIQKLKIRQSQAAMQVVILITDGREQGNTLDYEAEEAKKDLDSLPLKFESHKSSFWHSSPVVGSSY